MTPCRKYLVQLLKSLIAALGDMMNAQLFERQTPWNETYDVRVSEPNAAGDLLFCWTPALSTKHA